jgi:hypothetical protein
MSFDLSTGKKLWQHQATANDVFNVGCSPEGGAKNCTKDTVFRDVDFGASTILATQPGGKDIVLAGQKSGTVWAMDQNAVLDQPTIDEPAFGAIRERGQRLARKAAALNLHGPRAHARLSSGEPHDVGRRQGAGLAEIVA